MKIVTGRMLPVTEARSKLAEVLDELENDVTHTVVLVRRSQPAGILIHPDRYYALLEEIDHLESQAAVLYGQLHPEETISHDKLKAELGLNVG